jgi:hypothetical protein
MNEQEYCNVRHPGAQEIRCRRERGHFGPHNDSVGTWWTAAGTVGPPITKCNKAYTFTDVLGNGTIYCEREPGHQDKHWACGLAWEDKTGLCRHMYRYYGPDVSLTVLECSRPSGHVGNHMTDDTEFYWRQATPLSCGSEYYATDPVMVLTCIKDKGHQDEHFGQGMIWDGRKEMEQKLIHGVRWNKWRLDTDDPILSRVTAPAPTRGTPVADEKRCWSTITTKSDAGAVSTARCNLQMSEHQSHYNGYKGWFERDSDQARAVAETQLLEACPITLTRNDVTMLCRQEKGHNGMHQTEDRRECWSYDDSDQHRGSEWDAVQTQIVRLKEDNRVLDMERARALGDLSASKEKSGRLEIFLEEVRGALSEYDGDGPDGCDEDY